MSLRRFGASSAILLSIACAGGRGVAVADDSPVSRLSEQDVRRWARLLDAADHRRADTTAIDDALSSSTSALRAAGALAAGQIAVPSRASRLRALLVDADTAVAANAAFALGLMKDSASVDALDSALGRARTVTAAAAWSLGEIGEPARARIERVLSGGRPAAALAPALIASTKLRPPPASSIAAHLASSEPEVLWAASYAATRGRLPSTVRPLLALADRLPPATAMASPSAGRESAHEIRAFIARGLAHNVAGDSLATGALQVLRQLARDPHPHVRVNAARSLASHGAAGRSSVLGMLRDRDANVRIAVAQTLGAVLDSAGASWHEAWEADSGFTFRRSVLVAAARVGVRLPALDVSPAGWTHGDDWRRRAAVAEAVAAFPSFDRAPALVEPLLADTDGRVRSATVAALGALADSARSSVRPWSRALLLRSLADPDPHVRASVLGVLARSARATELPAVLAAYRASTGDPVNDARVAALRFVVAAWRSDSASFDDVSLRALRALGPTDDAEERAVARQLPMFAHWPSERRGPVRPLPSYAGIVRAFVAPSLEGRVPRAEILTERGRIVIELLGADAPLTVANFDSLARSRFYDGARFHRVVPAFVAQDGDPRGDGNGGPGYAIRDELNRNFYDRGAVGMALSGPDTGGSQYFLTHAPQPHLDGHYTVFGVVRDGLDVMDALVQGDRILHIRVR